MEFNTHSVLALSICSISKEALMAFEFVGFDLVAFNNGGPVGDVRLGNSLEKTVE